MPLSKQSILDTVDENKIEMEKIANELTKQYKYNNLTEEFAKLLLNPLNKINNNLDSIVSGLDAFS